MSTDRESPSNDRELIERIFSDGIEIICERGRDKFEPSEAEIFVESESEISSKIVDTFNKLNEKVSNDQVDQLIKNSRMVDQVINEYQENAWKQIYSCLDPASDITGPMEDEKPHEIYTDEFQEFMESDLFLRDIDEEVRGRYREDYLEPRFNFIVNSFSTVLEGKEISGEVRDKFRDTEYELEDLTIAYILNEKDIEPDELYEMLDRVLSIKKIHEYRDNLRMTMDFPKVGIGIDYTQTTLDSLDEVTEEYLDKLDPRKVDTEIIT